MHPTSYTNIFLIVPAVTACHMIGDRPINGSYFFRLAAHLLNPPDPTGAEEQHRDSQDNVIFNNCLDISEKAFPHSYAANLFLSPNLTTFQARNPPPPKKKALTN